MFSSMGKNMTDEVYKELITEDVLYDFPLEVASESKKYKYPRRKDITFEKLLEMEKAAQQDTLEFAEKIFNDANGPFSDKTGKLINENKDRWVNVRKIVKGVSKDMSGSFIRDVNKYFQKISENNYEFKQPHFTKPIDDKTETNIENKKENDTLSENQVPRVPKIDHYDAFKQMKFHLKFVDDLIATVKKKCDIIEKRLEGPEGVYNKNKKNVEGEQEKKHPNEEEDIVCFIKDYKLLKYLYYLRRELEKDFLTDEQFETRLKYLRETFRKEMSEALKSLLE